MSDAELIADLERRLAEYRQIKLAFEQTPKQWSTALAPTMEAVAHTARCFAAEKRAEELVKENERLRRDMQSMVSGFRSHIAQIASRIGPARRPEDIKTELFCLHESYNAWADSAVERTLTLALEELVKLQSHYAGLLNHFDGGARHQFANADEWIARLKELGQLPKLTTGC